MTISRSEAERILRPHLAALTDCILSAVSYFENQYSSERHYMSPRSCASLIHDLMVSRARSRFDGVTGVRPFVRRGLFHLEIEGVLWLRFKRLDRAKKARSIPTQQALFFLNQLEFPGMPPAPSRLTAGYVRNRLGTGIEGIYVTCPIGSQVAWFIELAEAPSEKIVEMPGVEAQTARPAKRVRPKEAQIRKLERDGPTTN